MKRSVQFRFVFGFWLLCHNFVSKITLNFNHDLVEIKPCFFPLVLLKWALSIFAANMGTRIEGKTLLQSYAHFSTPHDIRDDVNLLMMPYYSANQSNCVPQKRYKTVVVMTLATTPWRHVMTG